MEEVVVFYEEEEEASKDKNIEVEDKFAVIERGKKNIRIEPVLKQKRKSRSRSINSESKTSKQNINHLKDHIATTPGEIKGRTDEYLEESVKRKFTQKEYNANEFNLLKSELQDYKKRLNSKFFQVREKI